MILSSAQLHTALDDGRLIIAPEPMPRIPTLGSDHCPYDSHSVDLTLGAEISIPKDGPYNYDLTREGLAAFISQNSTKHNIEQNRPYQLEKNQFILGKTREWIELPIVPGSSLCLAARIEGKSSRARCGLLIHFTAPTVHPGFKGTLTLEMINLGPVPILLHVGMPIAQLIVEEVSGHPASWNPSQFQGQTTPEGIAKGNGKPIASH